MAENGVFSEQWANMRDPQALASTKINGLWTRLDNCIMKNWSKTSKSVSLSQNSILGPQTLELAHRDLNI
jgi:hypothetical protein